MWGNDRHSINIKVSYGTPYEIAGDIVDEKPFNKQVEKSLNFESDTDFQSFLLPLEQDLTKSSKGYASLISAIPNKEINDKRKLEESSTHNMSLNENYICEDFSKNTSQSIMVNNHPCSSDCDFIGHKNYTQVVQGTLKIINENEQNGENMFSENYVKSFNISKNFHTDNQNLVLKTDENVMISKECASIEKSDDDNGSSELSETDSHFMCNNLLNFVDSGSDDRVIFSENVAKNERCSTVEIKKTVITANKFNNSESSDDDCLEESKESSDSLSDDFDSPNFLKTSMTSSSKLSHSLIGFSSSCYINESFEDDDDILFEELELSFLKSINDSWNDSMRDVSDEPRESKRVSFVPLPNLVSVHSYEPDDDDYRYSVYVLDQIRFQNRIKDFEYIIAPYLTPEHRSNVYQKNYIKKERDSQIHITI